MISRCFKCQEGLGVIGYCDACARPLTWTAKPPTGPQDWPKHMWLVQVNGKLYVRDAKNKMNLGPLPEVPEPEGARCQHGKIINDCPSCGPEVPE